MTNKFAEFRNENGSIDISALYASIEPEMSGLERTFATFFGDTDNDGYPTNDEPAIITEARAENLRLANEREAERISEIKELVTTEPRNWHRLQELRAAYLVDAGDGLYWQLNDEAMEIICERSWGDFFDLSPENLFLECALTNSVPDDEYARISIEEVLKDMGAKYTQNDVNNCARFAIRSLRSKCTV